MPGVRDFGQVEPLTHADCSEFCRDLCFEDYDPRGVFVRLTHEVWLAKARQHGLYEPSEDVAGVIVDPWRIDEDTEDRRVWLYYSSPQPPRGKVFLVAVKCLPRRFDSGWSQQRHRLIGRVRGRPMWGEAWVSSAYWIEHPKSKGVRVWP